ncbi:MAG TPA: phosphotransferase [Actinopolymorphaceae bacterium]|jgi:aminoglycoside phosphotransferase (APT) family kinase protein|nr:phosphotransferase [Actinopolymorphaceae bacterium]
MTASARPILERKPDVEAHALESLVRKAFGADVPITHQRAPDGLCTQVYRLTRGDDVFYLRLADEAHQNLQTDATLLLRLEGLGVRVPHVVHVEPYDEQIGRSVLITTAIRGVPLEQVASRAAAADVLREAGKDIALLNQVPVDGFGWIRHDGSGSLHAQLGSYAEFVTAGLPAGWPHLLAGVFTADELDVMEALVELERARITPAATLAHGDFKLAHIYIQRGSYTGLIDFGEIRGTDPFFDLGYFQLNVPDPYEGSLLPAVVEGYESVRTLPDGHLETIRRCAVVHGLPELCGWLHPTRDLGPDHPVVAARASRISELLAQPD